MAPADASPSAPASAPDVQSMTPTERAAAKAASKAAAAAARDGPSQAADAAAAREEASPTPKVEVAAAVQDEKPKPPAPAEKAPSSVEMPPAPASAPAAEKPPLPEKPPTLAERMAAAESEDHKSHDASPSATTSGTSGKGKLARILGKGDFTTDSVDGPDVVDDSVYQKPKPWSSSSAPSRSKSDWRRRGPSKWKATPPKKEASQISAEEQEVLALRSELESQTKWEAVRLQEAVRAQMVEDSKTAAREAAEVARKHADELARVREEAVTQAEKMLAERTLEMKTQTEAERDADVVRLLKVKEDELREALDVEYVEKQRSEAMEREKALLDAKARVTALSGQFEAVIAQTEKAKEAAKRASSAFMLRQTVAGFQPIGSQLSDAGGKTELGELVVESVPDSAVSGGVPTVDMLKHGFHSASRQGLNVAMVPEGNAGTIWGQLLGAIFSRLKIPVDDRVEDPNVVPKTNEGRIRLARRLVEEGNLSGAIKTLEQLNGLSADVMSDWLGAAKARVAADLAAEVLLADAIIAQVAMTGGLDKKRQVVG